MSEAILHGYWRSSATYRVRIALNLKGVGWRAAAVNLLAHEQLSAEFGALHPAQRVPVLEIDGLRIGQSPAICEYLDETRPAPPLLPAGPADRARVRDLVGQIACDIHPLNNTSVLARLKEQFGVPQPQVEDWQRHWIARGFSVLERMLPPAGDFCFGDAPTLADVFLVPQVANARRVALDLSPFPTVARIDVALRSVKAFADAAPERQPEAAG
jgi:maleylacetoacetate isomerase